MDSIWSLPLRCFLNSLEHLQAWKIKPGVFIGLGLLLGWWIYVPIHELLHAAGCLITGGEVHELLIKPIYGGVLLERLFPFVKAGGEFAGRLSNFDTHGSDFIYGMTIIFPFLPGLVSYPVLAYSSLKKRPLLFGLALPWALAPLVTQTGDMYELGALTLAPYMPKFRALVTDDLLKLLWQSWSQLSNMDLLFIIGALLNGLSIAYALLFFSSWGSLKMCRKLQ